ncbi:MAG TPA: adenylate/guanylate cyclase domain-containing protein [Gaiellaceae bacterium]|nr:adenylate/guanylate cyclase domain-containing protein [Gaiellaceae bacterium]
MRELPRGTVTFLFTDIEGSTRLLHELGDGYADVLGEHRRALRAAFAAHGGVEVDTQGDAFFVAFARARDALAAAEQGQEALAPGPIRVRMGVHTGEPIVTDEGYVGLDVHRAARIAAVGHGGQVLVSQATRELAGPAGLKELGEHRLKDLTAPERIYQLGEGEFPPLRSLNQSNLPVQPTPFVGREKELGELFVLLRDPSARMLTLTGAGGSGKTRLALQAAAAVVEGYPDGVWWVPLEAVREPDRVAAEIRSALGASGDLAEHVGQRSMLLVIDNFEQVVDGAPALAELLARCPNVRMIVTSRELLRLAAEREYAVPPLVEQESVGFFDGRARVVDPTFEPDDHVIAICRRLDHLPLALELAAARVRALSTKQILERLEHALPLLTSGARDVPERQRTLRGAIGWSYELLPPDEQAAFRQLAVFAGGWSLDAAERVAGASLDALQSLVEKSLVRFADERYSLLETIREFALEQLEESDEPEATRRRHFDYFAELAAAEDTSAEAGYGVQPGALLSEVANLRAALDWAVSAGELERAVELMVVLENFWVSTDPFEGARRYGELLASGVFLPDRLRARATRAYAGSLWISGDYEQAHRMNERGVALFRELGDDEGIGVLLHRLGISTLVHLEDPVQARGLLERSREHQHRAGSERGEAEVVGALGYVARAEGDLEAALDHFSRSAELAAETGFIWWELGMLAAVVESLIRLERVDEAEPAARRHLDLSRSIGDRQQSVFALVLHAWIAARRGDVERAHLLWGAVEAEERRAPIGQWDTERDDYAARVGIRSGEEPDRARLRGRGLSLEAALDTARASG